MVVKKAKFNLYLKDFVYFCKKRYGKNLEGIEIYGSYIFGYFDKEKSDYDIFLIFNKKMKNEGKFLEKKFPRISIQYFCSEDELFELIKIGHWSLYITLLTSARMLYFNKKYGNFLKKLRRVDFIKNIKNIKRIKWKRQFDKRVMGGRGGKWVKYSLSALRVRLQFLTYARSRRLVWDLERNINLNKDFLDDSEKEFLLSLNEKVFFRKRKFSLFERKKAIAILNKLFTKNLFFLQEQNIK